MGALFRKERLIILALFIFALCLRVVMLFSSENHWGALPAKNILDGRSILGSRNFNDIWITSYCSILAAGSLIWKDPLIMPRIINLVFGVLLIFPFYYFVKFTLNTKEAIISTLLLCVYPLHVILSTVSIREIPFLFCLFMFLALFSKFIAEQKNRLFYLVTSAIFLSISTMFRLDSAVFIVILPLLLLKHTTPKRAGLFIVLSLTFIIFASVVSFYQRRSLCPYLDETQDVVKAEIMFARAQGIRNINFPLTFVDKISAWPRILMDTFNPLIILLGIIGLIKSLAFLSNRCLLYFFFSMYLLYNYAAIKELMIVNGQYSMILGCLLLPFFALGLEHVIDFVLSNNRSLAPSLLRKIKYGSYLLIIFVLIISCIKRSFAMRQFIPMEIKEAERWVRENVGPEDNVILGRDKWQRYFSRILLYGKLDEDRCLRTIFSASDEGSHIIEVQRYRDYLRQAKPKFILFFKEGFLTDLVKGKVPGHIYGEFLGYAIKPVFENKECIFYEIIYE